MEIFNSAAALSGFYLFELRAVIFFAPKLPAVLQTVLETKKGNNWSQNNVPLRYGNKAKKVCTHTNEPDWALTACLFFWEPENCDVKSDLVMIIWQIIYSNELRQPTPPPPAWVPPRPSISRKSELVWHLQPSHLSTQMTLICKIMFVLNKTLFSNKWEGGCGVYKHEMHSHTKLSDLCMKASCCSPQF